MLDKLRALFDGKTTTRLVLAGVAIVWGIQTITDTIRDMEAHADELAELIALRELTLASLDVELRNVDGVQFTFSGISDDTHPAGQGRTVPPSPFINHDTHDIDVTDNDESVAEFNATRGNTAGANGLVP